MVESFNLNHKHSHSPQVQVGLQQHLSQLRFVFLNFLSCVKITSVGLKLDRPCCTIGYCYRTKLIKGNLKLITSTINM